MIKISEIKDLKVRDRLQKQLAREEAAKLQQQGAPVPAPALRPEGHRLSGKTLCEVFTAEGVSTDEAKLNKTERAYLETLRFRGVKHLHIQAITLKLADDCRLTPDFSYEAFGVTVFVDVKGFQREDALIKMKVAARMFPEFNFVIVKRVGKYWDEKWLKP